MKWQTLAPELIYEILSQCHTDRTILSVTKPCHFPWHLGQICRTWREVFVSSPKFWNTLDIDLDFTWIGEEEEQKFTARALEVARIAMVRSIDYPISFRLTVICYSLGLPARTTMCRQMIKILVANSARWFDAFLYVPAYEMATIYAARNRMPLLRSIQLGLYTRDNTAVQPSDAAKLYTDFLMDAAQLTRISFDDDSPFWKINWSLITVIHFCAVPPLSQLLAYLSQMPYLMELVFLDDLEGDKTPNDGVPITLPHLKSLYSPPAALLPRVDTPALQELHIRNDFNMFENADALEAIISRYFQPMRQLLKLGIIEYNWDDTALIFEHMPRVDHLTLHSETPVELVKILKDYPQMGFLKTITFILDTTEVNRRDLILEIVTSWKKGTGENRGIGPFHNLMEISFKLLDDYHQPFVDGLKLHLEEQGMQYSIIMDTQGLSFPQFDVL